MSAHMQLFLLILIFLSIINHKYINEKLNRILSESDVKGEEIVVEKIDGLGTVLKEHGIKIGLFLVPLIMLIYSNMRYPEFFMKGLGKIVSIEDVSYVLRILGAYGIIQILAQDMGLKTGYVQRELVQSKIIQFFIFSGTAFALTNNISQAIMGTLLYFILKYSVSNNRTSTVCSERV